MISSADSWQNRRPVFLSWVLRWIWQEFTWHGCNSMTLFICCLFMLSWRHMAKQGWVFGHYDPTFGSHNQTLEQKPVFLFTFHKTLPNGSKLEWLFLSQSHLSSRSVEDPKRASSLWQGLLSLPCTLGGCGLILLSCSRAWSLQPAVREVKSLWAEASTECPLYMRAAYQSGNSLECCTTELLPPCVCVAAQESVYIVSLST